MIESNLKNETVSKIANSFEVEFVICTQRKNINGYEKSAKFNNKYIFSRNKKSKINIYKNLCLLLTTSGSTGDSKCVRISKDNLTKVTQSIVRYLDMNKSRVSISSLPLNYSYGLSVLNCALQSRSLFVLNEKSWLHREFWEEVEKNNVTDLSGVPFMFRILKRIKLSDKILRNLKYVNQAGGSLEVELTKYFIDYFEKHDVRYYTMYGATEASPRISYVPVENNKKKIGYCRNSH